ncbi:SLC13 family permease [Brevibacterium sp. 50QC2O2]|uniref:SLC13 family permease n=1 Tax=Brevibacterium TaxID=1696 RepID=UPI00211C141C|nr:MULTISPECIES: SLC13 family permease [unclassified Brevibacterium]MCQ9367519.1 SLC13 family permease [Brevibacterium sp. 91QC2O2]MCQ9385174.1 SLC13 family permease [Brevibacterium sp. 68QC2CO]MCQ9387797.1 SLC13 family permease [Brevibacterium sp. 50QC2O2]
MTAQLVAILIFIAIFAVGAIRGVHIGVLMLAGAAGVGLTIAHMKAADIVAGFPLDIMVLLVGVTLFFAIAQTNGTVDRLIDMALSKVGANPLVLPFVFFVLTGCISAMGAPLAGLVMMPIGMQVARRYNVNFALMGMSICFAIGAGGFAPTSLYGIVTYGTANNAGIDLGGFQLFGIALATYALMLIAAYLVLGRDSFRAHRAAKRLAVTGPDMEHNDNPVYQPKSGASAISRGKASTSTVQFGEDDEDQAMFTADDAHTGAEATAVKGLTWMQIVTCVAIVVLLASVVVLAAFGQKPDIGLICFGLSAILLLLDPSASKGAITKIDWSTVLLVGGIITYVGVLEEMGAVELLGQGAKSIGSPLIAAFVLCLVGGLVSAFASTTGILAALIPLALPMVADGALPGWALIAALGICSAVVDVSPFSTNGATAVATAPESEKPKLVRIFTWFGMSMVVVGPVLLVGGLVWPASLF